MKGSWLRGSRTEKISRWHGGKGELSVSSRKKREGEEKMGGKKSNSLNVI